MRRASTIVIVVAFCGVGFSSAVHGSLVASAAVRECAARYVRITDYNTLVGAGNVNDLFWIKNVSSQACSLRGYVRAEYIGVYGIGTPYRNPHRLSVPELRSYGRDGNDIGGLEKGLPIPSVTLAADGGLASFWLAGTDEPHDSPPSRCIDAHKMLVWLPGSSTAIAVPPLRANGFYWCGAFAAHPILPGASGSDPPKPLAYYFGTPG